MSLEFSPPAGGGIDDVFPAWRKSSIRVCPVTFPAGGGGGGATMAKQEAAPRWLSSESTTPVPQRGTWRTLTSRLRDEDVRHFPATRQPQADKRRQHAREGLAGC
jgi:hypothetical protein